MYKFTASIDSQSQFGRKKATRIARKGAQGFNCATIFNSNNYRQFSSSFAEVYLNKDPSFRPKMKFFGCTLLFYHFGVVYVYLILKAFSSYAIWSGLLPLVVAAVMIHLHRKELAVAKVE